MALVENLSKAEGTTVTTPWDAETDTEFETVLAEYGKVRLTQDISIRKYYQFKKDADIDLNQKTLTFNVAQTCFASVLIQDVSNVSLYNGTIITNHHKAKDDTEGGIRIIGGSTLTLKDVVFKSDHSGIFVTGDNSKFYADNLDLYINGLYTVSTNAEDSVSGIEIEIRNSKLVQDSPEGKVR